MIFPRLLVFPGRVAEGVGKNHASGGQDRLEVDSSRQRRRRQIGPFSAMIRRQLRAEFFNVWNWHIFNAAGSIWTSASFDTDISSPTFGMWNGAVTNPRNIQVARRLEF